MSVEIDNLRRALCLSVVAILAVVDAPVAGLTERPSNPEENPDRFVVNDGAFAITRPDESWRFEVDASEPPVVARMHSAGDEVVVEIQVQEVRGASLARLTQPIEQAIARQAEDFNKLSGDHLEVNGIAAYALEFSATRDGVPSKAKMLFYKPRDTLYAVTCSSSAEEWQRFERDCDSVLTGFEPLAEHRRRFVPTDRYEKRSIEGWDVYVNKDLLREGVELGAEALRLLETRLYEVGRVVPDNAREALRQVPIWLGVDDGHAPCAEYHPSREWLREHGYNPDKAKSVEIGNASLFLRRSLDQPAMVLHELAHAYHDRVLGEHAGLRAAFRAAVEGGNYGMVLRANGQEERAYAIENEREYFAEGTEAFFGTNDFYPFVRAELQRHDPKLLEVLEEVWGTESVDESRECSSSCEHSVNGCPSGCP